MICNKQFWVIFVLTIIMAMFGALHTYSKDSNELKYPNIERVEIGYKMKSLSDTTTIQHKVTEKEEKAKKKTDVARSANIMIGFYFSVLTISVTFASLVFLISILIAYLIHRRDVKKYG